MGPGTLHPSGERGTVALRHEARCTCQCCPGLLSSRPMGGRCLCCCGMPHGCDWPAPRRVRGSARLASRVSLFYPPARRAIQLAAVAVACAYGGKGDAYGAGVSPPSESNSMCRHHGGGQCAHLAKLRRPRPHPQVRVCMAPIPIFVRTAICVHCSQKATSPARWPPLWRKLESSPHGREPRRAPFPCSSPSSQTAR